MAFSQGHNARVYFNAFDLSAYLHSSGLDIEVGNADSTTLGATGWRTNVAGLASASATFDGYSDVALDAHIAAALKVDGGVLTYAIGGGTTIGDAVRLLSVTSTGLSDAASMDELAGFAWAVASQTYIGFGQVLHVLGEDTNTTTGATKDDAAATTDGWVAHLHVTAVDAGSWVVKLEDSANGSAWSDVTGGAFTAATGATAQRLQSAAGATLRRYVRYTATRTGGSGGDGITFQLSYARRRYQ